MEILDSLILPIETTLKEMQKFATQEYTRKFGILINPIDPLSISNPSRNPLYIECCNRIINSGLAYHLIKSGIESDLEIGLGQMEVWAIATQKFLEFEFFAPVEDFERVFLMEGLPFIESKYWEVINNLKFSIN